ncbi:MAG: phosphopantetheine-binding protein [Chloroflexota bacterium]
MADYVVPRSTSEEVVAEIWSALLGVDQVGVYDDFFDLGGHSLLAMRVVSRIRDAFEIELPLRSLFEATTVADLAEVVEAVLLAELEQLSDEEAEYLLSERY